MNHDPLPTSTKVRVAVLTLLLALPTLDGHLLALGETTRVPSLSELNRSDKAMDRQSKEFVDTNVPDILKTWSVAAFVERADGQFRQGSPHKKIQKWFSTCSQRLGPLQKYKGSTGGAEMSFTPRGPVATAEYRSNATFQKGDATILTQLIKRGNRWEIYNFSVLSNQFKLK